MPAARTNLPTICSSMLLFAANAVPYTCASAAREPSPASAKAPLAAAPSRSLHSRCRSTSSEATGPDLMGSGG